MPISYPSSYEYDDIIQGPENPNPSPPRTPTTWYIKMEERHYEDMRQRELEIGLEQLQVNQSQQRPTHDQQPNYQSPTEVEPYIPQPQNANEDEEVQSPNIRCLCAMEAHLVVVRQGDDVGRRYFRCPLYPGGCSFGQWVDSRFCSRAIAYALELEEENRWLRNQLHAYM